MALGHSHSPQSIGETIRYGGTPLKYAFSEAGQEKSVTVVELSEKGSLQLRTIPLKPLHDLRELRGRYEELTARSFYEGTPTEDYLHIVLTDDHIEIMIHVIQRQPQQDHFLNLRGHDAQLIALRF